MKNKVILLFGLTVLAGLTAWLVTIQVNPLVPLPPELSKTGVAEQSAEVLAIKLRHNLQNDCAGLAVFGGLVVAMSGFFFALRRPLVYRLLMSAVGLVLGAATGVLMGLSGHWLHEHLPIQWTPTTTATVIWAAVFMELAIAVSAIANCGLGYSHNSHKIWLGGTVGALLAAVVFPLLASLLFQFENSEPTLPLGVYSRATLFCLPTFLILSLIEYQHSGSQAPTSSGLPHDEASR